MDRRTVTIAAVGTLDASDVVTIRQALGWSQQVFAEALNVTPNTVRQWEAGRRVPAGSSVRLLELARDHPEMFRGLVTKKETQR